MDTWKTGQNFKKGSFPSREDFYSKLNIEHITENDNKQTKTKANIVTIKNVGENPDIHVVRDTLFLAKIFWKFYVLENIILILNFYSALGLAKIN